MSTPRTASCRLCASDCPGNTDGKIRDVDDDDDDGGDARRRSTVDIKCTGYRWTSVASLGLDDGTDDTDLVATKASTIPSTIILSRSTIFVMIYECRGQ